MTIPSGIRRVFAFGTGVGLQIDGPRGAESLHVTAVRVRPGGAKLLDNFAVEDFTHQPAGVWGTDYAAFLKKLGMGHAVATVVLPRHEVIVRTLSLPGVSDKDLAGAVQFQLEGLHPYNEDDVYTSWARLRGTSSVLVAIARRDAVTRYTTLLAEAGIRIGSFTCAAAVIYSARRLHDSVPATSVMAYELNASGGVEMYAESPLKPVFSASFAVEPERAAALTAAELRLESAIEAQPLSELLGSPAPVAYAAAVASACPRLSLSVNLLPAEQRQASSPMAWVPATALGVLVLLLAGGLLALPQFADRRYLNSLDAEMAKVQPSVARAAALDRQIGEAQKRAALLDEFRHRGRADMDVLAEMTRLLPSPAWLNLLEVGPRQVTIAGEIDQAAPLLQLIDASPMFKGSEFGMPPMRIMSPDGKRAGDAFRIRTNIEEGRP